MRKIIQSQIESSTRKGRPYTVFKVHGIEYCLSIWGVKTKKPAPVLTLAEQQEDEVIRYV